MQWQNPNGSLTKGVVIEDGVGNKLGTSANPLNVTGISGGGSGSNASVGTTGAAVPTSATALGYQNASGNLTLPTPAAGLPVADSGAAITGAAMPAGGAGLTGWLSAIWSKLSGTLAVSGTFWQATQPVSLAALPALPSGSNTIGNVTAAQSVGSGSIATAQATVASTATQIVAARAGAVGTGRIAVTIFNNGSATVYLGVSGVTTATGMVLLPGAAMTVSTTAAVYGIVSSTSQPVSALETF
jgi:hypothetical protein